MVAELKEVISKVEQLEEEEQRQIAKPLEDEIKLESSSQELNPNSKYDQEYLQGLRNKAKKHGSET
jgi:hypothetical protein